MSNHNYSQYSNKKNKKTCNKPQVEEPIEKIDVVENEAVPEVVYTFAAPVEPLEVKTEAPKAEVETTIIGTVVGCSKLNVRAKPSTDADILVVLDVNSEVKVDPARSAVGWVKVITAAGVEGFCMRKFISAKL